MTDLTRRKFIIVTALTAGFALAVHPISGATITTDTTNLVAGEVKIPVKDGEIPAYRAMPATGSNFPVVLVIQEIFGVHAHIQDVCRRFAKLGYLAIAPEMFARQGDVSKITDIQEIVSKVVSKVPDAQVMSDLDATVDWAQKSAKGSGLVRAFGERFYSFNSQTADRYCSNFESTRFGALRGQRRLNSQRYSRENAATSQNRE